jgi:shikimate kinase
MSVGNVGGMDSAPVHLVILGPMGVGKTTVGTIVAERLGWTLVDSDRVIEALHGMTGADIVAEGGVERLHRIEAEVLDEALSFAPPSVIAPAAAIVDDAALVDRLAEPGVRVAVLTCDPDVLAERAARSIRSRSLALEDAEELMVRHREIVEPLSDLTVDVTSLSPEAAADQIAGLTG